MKYVMIVNSIINIGGGQQYYRNKIVALKKRGIEVFLFHAMPGEIFIEELKQYKNNLFRELKYRPYCFKKSYVKIVLKKIIDIIGDDPDTIIDSSGIANAEWGELLAKEINAKHVCFLIDEHFEVSGDEADFFYFKLLRKELAGTSPKSVALLFSGTNKIIREDQKYEFKAYCTNIIEDCRSKLAEMLPRADYYIGCFGRLEKGYVRGVLKQLKSYVNSKEKYEFCIIVIGGSDDKKYVESLNKIFSNIKNAKVFFTGFLFPVPLDLLQRLDVCCASAGCARALVSANVLTLYVNVDTGEPIGYFNIDIPFGDHRYDKSTKSMDEFLNTALFSDYYKAKNNLLYSQDNEDFMSLVDEEIKNQLSFCNMETSKTYYDVFSLKPYNTKQKLYYFAIRLFGIRVFEGIHLNILHNLKLRLLNIGI